MRCRLGGSTPTLSLLDSTTEVFSMRRHPESRQQPAVQSRLLLPEQYEPLMSEYLRSARRLEQWHINWIEWDGHTLSASARLAGHSVSQADGYRFHLSIFSAREMDAQLAIIGLHLKLGLERKTAEVWLLRCTEECEAPITCPDDIRFAMQFSLRRSSSGKILSHRTGRISDARGGQIKLSALGLMPWRYGLGDCPVDS
jgi:hypothetical protein